MFGETRKPRESLRVDPKQLLSRAVAKYANSLAFLRTIVNSFRMSVPETTSAEAFERYVGGKCLRVGSGEAWRDIKAWTVALPHIVDVLHLPSVSEPFLAWSISGEVEFQEREEKGPWITQRLTKGSFFLTSGGAPYDCRWKALTAEPFESMAVFIALPLLQRALAEVFGDDAAHARLRNISAFTDVALNSWMERLREELMRRHASPLFLEGIAQAIAIHLARNYAETVKESLAAARPCRVSSSSKYPTGWRNTWPKTSNWINWRSKRG